MDTPIHPNRLEDPKDNPKESAPPESSQVALVKIIDALKGLSRPERLRVMKSASTFFGDPPNGSSGIR